MDLSGLSGDSKPIFSIRQLELVMAFWALNQNAASKYYDQGASGHLMKFNNTVPMTALSSIVESIIAFQIFTTKILASCLLFIDWMLGHDAYIHVR